MLGPFRKMSSKGAAITRAYWEIAERGGTIGCDAVLVVHQDGCTDENCKSTDSPCGSQRVHVQPAAIAN